VSRNPYWKARALPVGDLGVKLPARSQLPAVESMQLEFGEAELLYMLPLWIGGGHIVNLGDGGSATLMALSLVDHALEGHVSTVDAYEYEAREKILRERKALGVSERITLYNESTATACPKLSKCRLLFVDADHAYAGCRQDVELYAPLCQGYMAFHDTNQDDVARVIRELVAPNWDRVFWVNRIEVWRRR
jgi:hypothetical protein